MQRTPDQVPHVAEPQKTSPSQQAETGPVPSAEVERDYLDWMENQTPSRHLRFERLLPWIVIGAILIVASGVIALMIMRGH